MPSVETNTRKIVSRLMRDGWVKQDGGSHDKYVHHERSGLIVVPRHREQSVGVARSIAKLAGWIEEE